jgi:hypothetical protein
MLYDINDLVVKISPNRWIPHNRASTIVSTNLRSLAMSLPKDLPYLDSRLIEGIYTNNRSLMEYIFFN